MLKLLFLAACLTIFISQRAFSQSATVCTTAVNVAGFGMDGNLYANTPANANGDDWFKSNLYPGTAIGVVGDSAATAVPPLQISAAQFKAMLKAATTPAGRNITYRQGMRVPAGTNSNGQLMLDAMAARDNIGIAGERDSSIFLGNANKNGDNPLTWSIGIGSIPQKNDLVDVGGHVRLSTVNGHIIGFSYATTLSSDGDSHTDFEIFRQTPVFNALSGVVSKTGPAATGGHTAELFNADGTIKRAGDMIVSVDYSNGGTEATATVRVWINPNNVDSLGLGHNLAYINSKASRPFTFTGVFDAGVNTNGYGYAEIRPNIPNPCLIAAVENKTTVLGTPWGSLYDQQATYSDNINPLQLIEVSIDFTAFGLGVATASGTCEIYLGDLLVKTRSSQEFTASLKDYTGPYRFAIK